MGIEQSTHSTQSSIESRVTNSNNHNKTRQDSSQTLDDNGRSSPHPSLCSSDADVPYVSYTVNRPIGGIITNISLPSLFCIIHHVCIYQINNSHFYNK